MIDFKVGFSSGILCWIPMTITGKLLGRQVSWMKQQLTKTIAGRRVEPHVKFPCDIGYDPFQVMREKDLKYGKCSLAFMVKGGIEHVMHVLGWTISIKEYVETIPTLWDTVKAFAKEHPEHIVSKDDPESLLGWISNDGGDTYNLCHFWSNFEIGSLSWLRSQQYTDYFNYLDKAGGFFYER